MSDKPRIWGLRTQANGAVDVVQLYAESQWTREKLIAENGAFTTRLSALRRAVEMTREAHERAQRAVRREKQRERADERV